MTDFSFLLKISNNSYVNVFDISLRIKLIEKKKKNLVLLYCVYYYYKLQFNKNYW